MSLRAPEMLLPLVPLALLALWRLRYPAKRRIRFVANTASIASLPSYKKVKQRGQLLRIAEISLLSALVCVLLIIAAGPQKQVKKIDNEHSRDIVLCLDASGSMQQYIPAALKTMSDVVAKNPTDRYSVVVFQNESYAVLPLTTDVTAIQLKTKDLAAQLDNQSAFAARLLGYNSSIDSGTDIGAGLAGCVRRFDNLTQPRSRHIIMISDMDNNGSTNQAAVAQLLPKYGIKLYIVAPSLAIDTSVASSPVTQITNASVSTLQDADSVSSVLNNIYQTILSTRSVTQYVAADAPYPWWLAALAITYAWAGVLFLRWRRP